MREQGRTTFERLLYVGILTFILWPFVQLWSIHAVPLYDSDSHQRAAVAIGNLMAEALGKYNSEDLPAQPFASMPGFEDLELEGSIEIFPHPEFTGLSVIRAQVRWGFPVFRKYLTLETLVGRTRP